MTPPQDPPDDPQDVPLIPAIGNHQGTGGNADDGDTSIRFKWEGREDLGHEHVKERRIEIAI